MVFFCFLTKQTFHFMRINLTKGVQTISMLIVLLIFLSGCKTKSYKNLDNGFKTNFHEQNIIIQLITSDIVRISKSLNPSTDSSLIVKPQHLVPDFSVTENQNHITLAASGLKVVFDKQKGIITIFNSRDEIVLREKQPGIMRPVDILGDSTHSVQQSFQLFDDEALYGLGQYQDGVMNYRGHEILMVQSNSNAVVPFLISTNKYGILWDNYSKTIFKDVPDSAYLWSEVGESVDYYVVTGEVMDDVIAGYRELTGKAPLFGKWAYGFWQCKERYKTSEELLHVVKEYRKRNIPIDNIVQDWQYWPEGQFSGMTWDRKRYPNLNQMIDSLHNLNVRLMVSIWPAVGKDSEIYKELNDKDLLFHKEHWGGARVYDAFSEEARAIYWKYLKTGLFDHGVDAFWMDGTEPEFMSTGDRYVTEASVKENKSCAFGNIAKYLNLFSYYTTQGVYNNQRSTTDNQRAFILTRSAFAGQQAYAAATWSGDIHASWQVFKNQIVAGINIGMAGIPYWTSDIGAFLTEHNYPNALNSNAYKELYLRWYQFGTFNSIFRAHGTDIPREIWQFGEEGDWVYDGISRMNNLRYRLLPYIYSTAWQTTDQGYSFIRGLPLAYPDDKKVHEIDDQYMFGESIMVCPVTQPMYYNPGYEAEHIPSFRLLDEDGKNPGSTLQFYEGTDFHKLVNERKSESLTLSWFGDLPLELKDSEYSVRWTGSLLSDNAGIYNFLITTNGGVRFWLNNKLLIDQWENQTDSEKDESQFKLSPSSTFKASVNLNADTIYSFKLENRQYRPNEANIFVEWNNPAIRKSLTVADSRERKIYLPGTHRWYDFWSGEAFEGMQYVNVKAPIQQIPMFIKAGTILPLAEVAEHAAAIGENLTFRIYPGEDGSFELYEDDGLTYDYEAGAYTLIPLNWNDDKKELVIGSRQGSYSEMIPTRIFRFSVVDTMEHTGMNVPSSGFKSCEYSGDEMIIRF